MSEQERREALALYDMKMRALGEGHHGIAAWLPDTLLRIGVIRSPFGSFANHDPGDEDRT